MDDEEGSESAGKTVPYAKFAEARTRGTDALNRVSELEAEVATLRGSLGTATTAAEGHAAALEAATAAAANATARYDTYRACAAHGLTEPDLVDAASWAYSRTPEEGRLPLDEALSAWKAKPEDAPLVLRPHLVAPVPAPAKPGPDPAPPSPGGRNHAITAKDLAAARGNPERLRALHSQLAAQFAANR